MKKIKVLVAYQYDLEVDENHELVNEFQSQDELLVNCAIYRFDYGMPVIKRKGVLIKDIALVDVNLLRACRVCGCTQNNCSQCIEKTGGPCYWVEDDLCSACEEQ